MPKIKLSKPQQEIVDVLAHIMAASHITASCEGMSDFLDYYLKKALTDRQRAIYQALKDRSVQVRRDIAAMLEKEQKDKANA
jgi:hypothetical protein